MNFNNTEIFLTEYKKNLIEARAKYPDQYAWPETQLDEVFTRMKNAIIRGNFNKDSQAFRKTCKDLKIKHTYRDIETFLKSE